MNAWSKLSLALVIATVIGCTRGTISDRSLALRLGARVPMIYDAGNRADLELAVRRNLATFPADPTGGETSLEFGTLRISRNSYRQGLERFLELSQQFPDPQQFQAAVAAEFEFLEAYGQQRWGDVFITGYFEPVIEVRAAPEGRFTQAIYRRPRDLVTLNLGLWGEKFLGFPGLRGRQDGTRVVPYYDRRAIDHDLVLQGQGLEIAWGDPVDVFFMHIQGSGTLRFPDGQELAISYAEKNGHRYEAIGRFLKEKIAPQPITMQTIEQYVRSLSPADQAELLYRNPSYVFFDPNSGGARTALGVSATAERTIATDRNFFPKGSLAFLTIDSLPGTKGPTARYVLDQDVGGAITGPGRVDFFCGRGDSAKALAGPLQSRGTLLYLVPRDR